MELTHTLAICWSLVRASVRGQMQYRTSFIMEVAAGLAYQSVGFLFVWAILSRFQALGGWTLEEIAMLYGIRLTAHGLYMLFFSNLFRIDDFVREGGYDRLLVRPLPALLQLMFTAVRVTVLGDLIGGVVILGAALARVDVVWTPAHALLLALAILGGALIDGAFQIGPAALTFRFLESWPLRVIFDDVFSRFGNYPTSILDRPARNVLTFIVPMAFMAYLPASTLLERETFLPLWVGWLAPAVGAVMFVLALWVFARASRGYQSSGH
ncbi:MAG TPA: ABC-2 family transporter protein [Thermomicrobiales bacterium]|nr:ABC-2 family transporter protein [Thermomicrobiales bacterium]